MTPTKRRRLLSEAEIEIWLTIAQSVTPRPGAMLPQRKAQPIADPMSGIIPVVEPKRQPSGMPGYTPPLQGLSPKEPPLAPFEKRYRQRVAHGRVEIDGVLDLHGMTQAEAHGALIGFLRGAHRNGARLVLVVTGKGRSRMTFGALRDAEPGVLRRAVPHWLRAPELRTVVMGFEEAGLPHGGMGALYVRLRRMDR